MYNCIYCDKSVIGVDSFKTSNGWVHTQCKEAWQDKQNNLIKCPKCQGKKVVLDPFFEELIQELQSRIESYKTNPYPYNRRVRIGDLLNRFDLHCIKCTTGSKITSWDYNREVNEEDYYAKEIECPICHGKGKINT